MHRDQKNSAIVIGASAGGLHALTLLLEELPANYTIPVIIVQHRIKDQRDLLEEVLQHKCKITVKQADEKERISPGIVYIAPPDYHLMIENDETFALSVDGRVKFSRPSIDVLFESAAETFKEKLIGIILTGANNDGAEGMKTIRKFKGVTIAQDPLEAECPVMPRSAIETGAVQLVLTLAEIRNFLLQL